jgi:integrase
MRLTKATVARLALPEHAQEKIVFDDALPGFGLRIRAGGKRTWIAQYRMGTKQRRVTLGSAETFDADEARKLARAAFAKVQLGTDPQLEKTGARAQAAVTLGSVVDHYLARHAAKRQRTSTYEDTERYLRVHWAALAEHPLQKVSRADVAARLSCIAEDSGRYAANRARAALSAFYGWAIAEGLADANPVIGTRKPADEVARDRVLGGDELAMVWREAGGGDFGSIVRLLILTGQRREEVAAMTWAELDLDAALWRIGADRTKNGRAHEVPLAEPAVAILRKHAARERRDECRALVFGSRDGPFAGWSKAKAALDARLATAHRRPLSAWRLHDLRRTVATGLADLGTLPHVVEAVLNHISGHKAGVSGVYNRAGRFY